MTKEAQLFHKDDFILNQVLFTTFTPENNILVALKGNNYLAFDMQSRLI